jgi:hypothetical protein
MPFHVVIDIQQIDLTAYDGGAFRAPWAVFRDTI